ncbi:MAG: hypothetical protein ACOC79_01790, partial [Thermodesulfobacteriota bacterium]
SQDRHLTLETYDRVVRSLFETLTYTEQAYFETPTSRQAGLSNMRAYFQMKQDISEAFSNRNFPYVVQACRRLESLFGQEALTPDTAMLYAVALGQEGELKEAVSTGKSVIRKLDQLPDPIQLRADLAQWFLKLGEKEEAVVHHEALSDIQDQRAALIKDLDRALQGGDAASPPTMESPLPGTAGPKPGLATFTELDPLLEGVDALLEKNQFQEAKLLLIRHRLTFEDPEQTETIDTYLQKIEALAQEYEEERMIREAYVQETLEGAKRLLEAEKFEDAVDKLSKIEGDEEFMAASKALRERAVENIINRERNRAATLFLEARRTQDPSKKEQLLQQSFEILKALADKYPSSPLHKKVLSHIDIVKKELGQVQE